MRRNIGTTRPQLLQWMKAIRSASHLRLRSAPLRRNQQPTEWRCIMKSIRWLFASNRDFPIRRKLANHFIHGMYEKGQFEARQTDKGGAELAFHQRIHGQSPMVFREAGSGAYVAFALAPMAGPPQLTITFNRRNRHIEQIPFDGQHQPTHKVRFWVCDKGGKNKRDDLREHITSIRLDV